MTDKVIRDGRVAVLYSPAYGAGWSSWTSDEYRDFFLFDPELITLAEHGAGQSDVDAYIKSKLGENAYFSIGGWSDIEIAWLPKNTSFRIIEYDGSESISTTDDMVTA